MGNYLFGAVQTAEQSELYCEGIISNIIFVTVERSGHGEEREKAPADSPKVGVLELLRWTGLVGASVPTGDDLV